MNAGAYGSDWSAILVRALVATADGTGWLTPAELGALVPALEPAARPGRRRRRVPARSARRTRSAPRVRELVERRKAHPADDEADVRLGLQEPAGRARRRGDARAVRPQGVSRRRRVDLAEARELHRERGRCDDGRLSRADGRGAPSRARGVRRRARARGRCCSGRSEKAHRASSAVSQRFTGNNIVVRRRATESTWSGVSRNETPVDVGGRRHWVWRRRRSLRGHREQSNADRAPCARGERRRPAFRDGSPTSASILPGSSRRAARSPSPS